MSGMLEQMVLEIETEQHVTTETLRALLEEERQERAEIRSLIEMVLKNGGVKKVNGDGRSVSITVIARDENDRVKTVEIKG
jgi:hypothetical protein